MISDDTRREVWGEKEDTRRVVLYYALLGTRRARQQIGIRTAVLFSISGGFSPLVAAVPSWVGLGLTTAAVLLTVVESQLGWGAQAALSRAISTACSLLLDEWQDLWRDANGDVVEEEQVVDRMKKLRRLDILVTSRASAHGVNHSESLNRKASAKVLIYTPIERGST